MARTAASNLQDEIELVHREAFAAGSAAAMLEARYRFAARPGVADDVGRGDIRTGWLRGQSPANPSLGGNSLLTGKITGNIAKSGPIAASVTEKALVIARA